MEEVFRTDLGGRCKYTDVLTCGCRAVSLPAHFSSLPPTSRVSEQSYKDTFHSGSRQSDSQGVVFPGNSKCISTVAVKTFRAAEDGEEQCLKSVMSHVGADGAMSLVCCS